MNVPGFAIFDNLCVLLKDRLDLLGPGQRGGVQVDVLLGEDVNVDEVEKVALWARANVGFCIGDVQRKLSIGSEQIFWDFAKKYKEEEKEE